MRNYEIVWIVKGDSETSSEKLMDNLKNAINQNDGSVHNVELIGKRSLAYPIKNHEEGIYFSAKFQMDQNKAIDFESSISLDQDIIRHLIVKLKDKVKSN